MALVATPCPSLAQKKETFRLGVGAGATDSGDGRFRPAVAIEVGFPSYASARYFSYGYRAGNVSQFGGSASLGREWTLTKDVLRARAGFAYLREETHIRQADVQGNAQGDAQTLRAVSQNIGLAFGFRAQGAIGRTFIALDWQNDCYFAGPNAILGSFGRRQFVTLEAGVSL